MLKHITLVFLLCVTTSALCSDSDEEVKPLGRIDHLFLKQYKEIYGREGIQEIIHAIENEKINGLILNLPVSRGNGSELSGAVFKKLEKVYCDPIWERQIIDVYSAVCIKNIGSIKNAAKLKLSTFFKNTNELEVTIYFTEAGELPLLLDVLKWQYNS